MGTLGPVQTLSQGAELPARQVQPERPQLGDEPVMAARRLRLSFERPELAAHLSLKVLQTQQVLLARFEATLGPLAAPAELEDACGLLDHHAPVLRARLEHRVELPLADDHVLLAADARVGEKFLYVEQPARCPVERILALSRAEQRPCDRDLRHVHRQASRGVVDGQGDLRGRSAGLREVPAKMTSSIFVERTTWVLGRPVPRRRRRRHWTCRSRSGRRPR